MSKLAQAGASTTVPPGDAEANAVERPPTVSARGWAPLTQGVADVRARFADGDDHGPTRGESRRQVAERASLEGVAKDFTTSPLPKLSIARCRRFDLVAFESFTNCTPPTLRHRFEGGARAR